MTERRGGSVKAGKTERVSKHTEERKEGEVSKASEKGNERGGGERMEGRRGDC
jgi:hypothetical protein